MIEERSMNILCYRYGSIVEPDIIDGFKELGNQVSEICLEIYNKKHNSARRTDRTEGRGDASQLRLRVQHQFLPFLLQKYVISFRSATCV